MTCDLRPLPCAWQPLIGIAPETGSRLDLLRRSSLLRRSQFPAKGKGVVPILVNQ